MKIQFCGAATSVTGSCHLITAENFKILLDCGQFQGNKAMDAMNYEEFPFDPSEIDYMILSHAHIDHCGLICKGKMPAVLLWEIHRSHFLAACLGIIFH